MCVCGGGGGGGGADSMQMSYFIYKLMLQLVYTLMTNIKVN